MFDRVALTICAYLFGSLCARYLEPGTSVAEKTAPPASAIAQVSHDEGSDRKLGDDETAASAATPESTAVAVHRATEAKPALSARDEPAPPIDQVAAVAKDESPTAIEQPAEQTAEIELAPQGVAQTELPQAHVETGAPLSAPETGRYAPLSDIIADIYKELARNDTTRQLVEAAEVTESAITEPDSTLAADPSHGELAAVRVAEAGPKNGHAAEHCPGAPAFDEPAPSQPRGIYADQARLPAASPRDPKQELSQDRTDQDVAAQPPAVDSQPRQALTLEQRALARKIHHALDIYRHQNLNTRDNSAWSIMHSLIGFGVEKEIHLGGPTGKPVNAIGWICFNGLCRGERLFYMNDDLIVGRLGPGRQGHHGQFLAMLAQSRVKSDYPLRIGGAKLTVDDLVRSEMKTCRPNSELTFKLIGISHYVDTNEKWTDNRGEQWTLDRVVREELKQKITGAACGGTHRLFGLAYALDRRRRSGEPVEGTYKRTEKYLNDYHEYTFKLQNRDGSFSTEWFAGRGAKPDIGRRLETTGHTAEWLSFSLPEDQLHRPEMVRAIDYLADLLIEGRRREWKIGPLGHALHALNLYQDRAFPQTAERPVEQLTDAD